MNKTFTLIIALASFFLITTPVVFAYLDPGTGAAIIGSIIPLILAVCSAVLAFLIKHFWKPIKIFFSKFKKQNTQDQPDQTNTQTQPDQTNTQTQPDQTNTQTQTTELIPVNEPNQTESSQADESNQVDEPNQTDESSQTHEEPVAFNNTQNPNLTPNISEDKVNES